ncbi:MAG: insulinase family protein [Desulfobulbaceae bacterium]|nr:insulinase family protein [Desulfobulbaceae bacterium]
MRVRKTILDNGVRIITEREPSRLVSLGIWVEVGSRDEDEGNNGSAHFAEHMFFKGTRRRDAQRIAREFDILGGMSNAFTSNEHTSYYATVLDRQLAGAVELLADIFFNSLFSQTEIELERQVILQEIAMVEDTPDDLIHELFSGRFWQGHPLANTVLGRSEVVEGMVGKRLRDYVRRKYLPGRIVIAAAGNVEHERFVELWRPWLDKLVPPKRFPAKWRPPGMPGLGGLSVVTRPLEQEHLVLGCNGLAGDSADRYALLLLNTILGGNMSSRLFQEIREKRGLAYSVYSYLVSHSDCGYAGIYLGVDPDSLPEVLGLVRHELRRLHTEAVSAEELADAVDYVRAGMYLAAENMEARMTRLARNEYTFGRDIAMEEVASEIEKLRPDDLLNLAGRIFGTDKLTLAAIGPVSEDKLREEFGDGQN